MKSKLVVLCLASFCICLFVSCQSKPEDHYNSAIVLAKNKEYKLAIKELDEAIAKKPNYAEAYLERGKYRLSNQDYREANGDTSFLSKIFKMSAQDFTKAMEYDPNLSKEALLGRGNCYFILKSYQNAADDFNNLLKSDSTNKAIIGVLVWSKLYMKDTIGAKILLDRVISLAPNDAEIYYSRAIQRLISFNNKSGACEDLDKAEKLYTEKEKYLVENLIGNIKNLQKINCSK